jgi:hypothetical protein
MQREKEIKVRQPSTQESRVLKVLEEARDGKRIGDWIIEGGWVNKQYFIRELYLTQAGRAIWNLENRMGVEIEHSDFKDIYGFKSYRLPIKNTLF